MFGYTDHNIVNCIIFMVKKTFFDLLSVAIIKMFYDFAEVYVFFLI